MKKFIKLLSNQRINVLIVFSSLLALCYFLMVLIPLVTGGHMFIDDPLTGKRILSDYSEQMLNLGMLSFIIPGLFVLYTSGQLMSASILNSGSDGWVNLVTGIAGLFFASAAAMMYGGAFTYLGITPEAFSSSMEISAGVYGYTVAGMLSMFGFARSLALKEDCLSLMTL